MRRLLALSFGLATLGGAAWHKAFFSKVGLSQPPITNDTLRWLWVVQHQGVSKVNESGRWELTLPQSAAASAVALDEANQKLWVANGGLPIREELLT